MSQQNPEGAVPASKAGPRDRTLQGPQLLAQREVFKDQFVMAAAGQRQCSCDQQQQFQHAAIVAA
jgi:hypothetical protein